MLPFHQLDRHRQKPVAVQFGASAQAHGGEQVGIDECHAGLFEEPGVIGVAPAPGNSGFEILWIHPLDLRARCSSATSPRARRRRLVTLAGGQETSWLASQTSRSSCRRSPAPRFEPRSLPPGLRGGGRSKGKQQRLQSQNS
jgi:hypothetical protein